MTVIAIVGATTAVFAAIVSLTQSDIKKMLAYSTISQIGFMIMTCGLGAFVAAIFHMLAHGFLKGFLFLSTGESTRVGGVARDTTNVHSGPSRNRPRGYTSAALMLACTPPLADLLRSITNRCGRRTIPAPRSIAFLGDRSADGVLYGDVPVSRDRLAVCSPLPSAVVQPRLFSPLHLVGITRRECGRVWLGILVALWSWFVPFLAPAVRTPYPLADGIWSSTVTCRCWYVGLRGRRWLAWAVAARAAFARPLLSFVPRSKLCPDNVCAVSQQVLLSTKSYSVYVVQPILRLVALAVACGRRLRHQSAWSTGSLRCPFCLSRWMWQNCRHARHRSGQSVEGWPPARLYFPRWLWRDG